jgi:large subunit ribosomal protein L25
MAKVVDHHPVRHTIAHVDFLVVDRNEKVTTDVPVVLVGTAELVTREGGVVEQLLHTIVVTMLPNDIPDSIEADISGLEVGGAVRVADLRLPRGVTTEVDPETPVANAAHAAVLEEPVVAAEAGEAGEAGAEGQESAAAAEGDTAQES